MSFTFGFTNADLSDDEIEGVSQLAPAEPASHHSLIELSKNIDPSNAPQQHSLDSLLDTLVGVRITFDNYTTPCKNVVYRRELFDVKHQVMCEDNASHLADVLLGDENNDLKKNVYEGGFKSWECSYDVVDKLNEYTESGYMGNFSKVLDMGCGTSLPTGFLLMKRFQNGDKSPIEIILADFNYDVLRLVSLPNLLIHWASTLPVETLVELTFKDETPQNDVLVVTPELVQMFKNQLKASEVTLSFVSGAWGSQFNNIVAGVDFIISSETIYSLDTLPLLAEALIDLANRSANAHILVAAKDIYFGVGGSVVQFTKYLEGRMNIEVEKVEGASLGRSLVHLKRKQT